jgi:hypothetical protein
MLPDGKFDEMHEPHRNKIVGVRSDIYKDGMKKFIWELEKMDRLIPSPKR